MKLLRVPKLWRRPVSESEWIKQSYDRIFNGLKYIQENDSIVWKNYSSVPEDRKTTITPNAWSSKSQFWEFTYHSINKVSSFLAISKTTE